MSAGRTADTAPIVWGGRHTRKETPAAPQPLVIGYLLFETPAASEIELFFFVSFFFLAVLFSVFQSERGWRGKGTELRAEGRKRNRNRSRRMIPCLINGRPTDWRSSTADVDGHNSIVWKSEVTGVRSFFFAFVAWHEHFPPVCLFVRRSARFLWPPCSAAVAGSRPPSRSSRSIDANALSMDWAFFCSCGLVEYQKKSSRRAVRFSSARPTCNVDRVERRRHPSRVKRRTGSHRREKYDADRPLFHRHRVNRRRVPHLGRPMKWRPADAQRR